MSGFIDPGPAPQQDEGILVKQDGSNEDRRKNPLRLWELDCAALTTLLGICFSPDELRERFVEHFCSTCAEQRDDEVRVYWASHRSSHRESAFSESLDAELNRRDPDAVRWVRGASSGEIVRAVRSDRTTDGHMPTVLFALLTDPDEMKRSFGHYLVHAYLKRGLNLFRIRAVPLRDADRDSSRRISDLVREVSSLRAAVKERENTIDRMLEYVNRTRHRASPK